MVDFVGTNAAETLPGSSGDDVLIGLGGNDALRGGDGNDVYIFYGAFGQDTVTDASGVDQIRIGSDYGPQDFRLVRSSSLSTADLVITQVGGTQSIALDRYFAGGAQVESVLFERTGTVWNLAGGAAFRSVGFTGTNAGETVLASSGDDVLIGLGGNDALRGGDGNDVYIFYGAFGQDTIADTSGVDQIRIGADYSERDFRPVRNSSLSTADLVITQVGGTQSIALDRYFAPDASRVETVLFERTGTVWELGSGQVVVRRGFFDYDGYLSANPDVRAAGIDPYAHYVTAGWREGRDPSARFDTSYYLQKNPDVAAAGVNPLVHYLASGQAEGRATSPAVGNVDARGFDSSHYLLANPDVGLAGLDPAAHYAAQGWREGRNPSGYFDTNFYLTQNPDVRAAGIDPLAHYGSTGWRQGRDPSPVFDTTAYLAANPDVAAAGVNPLVHWLASGIYEGRSLGAIGIA